MKEWKDAIVATLFREAHSLLLGHGFVLWSQCVVLLLCLCCRFHWKYKCDASATGGGSASYEWTDSGEGAAKGAIVALLQSMTTPGECNGSAGVAPVGTCKIPYQIFFYFASSSDLDNKVASYKASVTAPNGAVSTVTAQTNAEDAVKNAVTAMVTANPAIATQCGL